MTIKVDYAELEKLQTETARAQSALAHGLQILGAAAAGASGRGVPTFNMGRVSYQPYTPFGNTSEGGACAAAHGDAFAGVGAAVRAFAATVDSDAERLKLAITLYKVMDHRNAEEFLRNNRNGLDLFSTHLSKNDTSEQAQQQLMQLRHLLGLAGGPLSGNTVIAGDLNAVADPRDVPKDKPFKLPSAEAIRNFDNQNFDHRAGEIHDGPDGRLKGTSAGNAPIDHVLPRGVGTAPAERWQRWESDHDGQRVDVAMPAW
ncbi:endonuclease/exonuclease/phosphatase family protein [Nocardia sp. CDC159]|uniref:Endonuclease/exonuclease/phosphatase family protein n=1 Tax=Nocardia pulmonis TaxID=2951408 RepID=A0A9X2IYG8_9NOCA|nr:MULTISPECIES: endonuclease/exonuclease/phosphatase family protein [Nocardia]MCM6773906.1 endonuclease/exonuclease/phosphatase family protein [Nocardia pulmonis]MCM6786793.1 endonuclease/exonuclease/phosphatase family protein [Nocardia sp. CDC159]